MVVMEVAEERVRHVDRVMPALQQPVMGAGTVIQHDDVAANFDEVAGALARE